MHSRTPIRALTSSSSDRRVNGNAPAFLEISLKVAREVFILSAYEEVVFWKMVVLPESAVLNCVKKRVSL